MTEAKKQSIAKKQIIRRMQLRSGRAGGKKGSELRERDRQVSAMGGYLIGGQAKIAAKAPPTNKIDEKDFAVLRAEKAKKRGKGLQDEKMKPGKVMKAMVGVMAIKKAADKISKESGTPKGLGLGIGMSAIKTKKMKEILGKKMGGKIIKAKEGKSVLGGANKPPKIKLTGLGSVLGGKGGPAGRDAKSYRKYLKGLAAATKFSGIRKPDKFEKFLPKPVLPKQAKKLGSSKFIQRRMTLGGADALKAAKATRIGKIAAGVAAAALLAKAGLEKMYEKRTGKKPFTKREKNMGRGKMAGGMMNKKPMMAKKGKAVMVIIGMKPKKKMGGGLMEATQKLKAQGKMGGGMMQRPMMAMGGGMMPGYKKGKSVMAKGCKLGRKKPTKMYT